MVVVSNAFFSFERFCLASTSWDLTENDLFLMSTQYYVNEDMEGNDFGDTDSK